MQKKPFVFGKRLDIRVNGPRKDCDGKNVPFTGRRAPFTLVFQG